MAKVKVGIIGATGYAGAEILRLLLMHRDAEVVWIGSRSFQGKEIASEYPNFRRFTDLQLIDDDTDRLKEGRILELADEVDVVFTATPQGACASLMSEELLKRTKIIDMSADFRLKDVAVYERWYKITHLAPDFLPEAVYGLTELHREEVKNARILANPGCYTTCSILTAYPLVKAGVIDPSTLIIDALSGVSGAGRSGKVANLFSEVNESAKAYGVASHRHTPEIEQELSLASGEAFTLTFTPHLVPMNRGILATEYAALTKKADGSLWTEAEIRAIYEEAYGNEAFIRLLPAGVCPDTRAVEGTNLVDINFKLDPRTGRIILMGALDNLMKGAAGQAVQNMNVMFGLPETEGLEFIPVMP